MSQSVFLRSSAEASEIGLSFDDNRFLARGQGIRIRAFASRSVAANCRDTCGGLRPISCKNSPCAVSRHCAQTRAISLTIWHHCAFYPITLIIGVIPSAEIAILDNALDPNLMSAAERLTEVGEILAAGLLRLRAKQRQRLATAESFPWTSSPARASMRKIAGAEKRRGKQCVSAAGRAPGEIPPSSNSSGATSTTASRRPTTSHSQAPGVPHPGAGLRWGSRREPRRS